MIDMSSDSVPELVPSQLPFDKLKRIASRLLLLDAYGAVPVDASAIDLAGVHHVHMGAFAVDARRSISDVWLDDHVSEVIREARRVGDDQPEAARAISPMLADLDARRAGVNCERCAGVRRCRPSGPDNDRNVTRGGECVSSLMQHFEDIRVAIEAQIARALPRPIRELEIALAIRYSNGAPHPFGVRYMVSGEHSVKDMPRPERARGVVALTFQIDELDLLTYRAVTYVLFHELVCHAWDGIAEVPRAAPRDRDSFGDGWMDFVATCAATSWLHGLWSDAPEPPADRFDRVGIAWAFHRARVERPSRRIATGPEYQRAAGAEAAQRFLGLLAARHGDRAIDLLLGWSLYLSVQRPRHRELFLRWNPGHRHTDRLLFLIGDNRFDDAWTVANTVLEAEVHRAAV